MQQIIQERLQLYTVRRAARELGISKAAIRNRMKLEKVGRKYGIGYIMTQSEFDIISKPHIERFPEPDKQHFGKIYPLQEILEMEEFMTHPATARARIQARNLGFKLRGKQYIWHSELPELQKEGRVGNPDFSKQVDEEEYGGL